MISASHEGEPAGEFFVITYLRLEEGDAEGQFLHRGTQEECERMMGLISAISYSGGRAVKESGMRAISVAAFDADNMPQVGQWWKS